MNGHLLHNYGRGEYKDRRRLLLGTVEELRKTRQKFERSETWRIQSATESLPIDSDLNYILWRILKRIKVV